jgi:hypothetical protein
LFVLDRFRYCVADVLAHFVVSVAHGYWHNFEASAIDILEKRQLNLDGVFLVVGVRVDVHEL